MRESRAATDDDTEEDVIVLVCDDVFDVFVVVCNSEVLGSTELAVADTGRLVAFAVEEEVGLRLEADEGSSLVAFDVSRLVV